MASAGIELSKRIPELVGRIFDEHPCEKRPGARERVMAHASKSAQWLGQVIEAEEISCHAAEQQATGDPSDPYGKQVS